MVLDISRWIDEHPGGPSIIPSQALNIDCTCFFEMYHVSRQSFLYLKSFYIGELNPADLVQLKGNESVASVGFLHSLRSYTDQWRVEIEEHVGDHIHKSL
jgi:cytochrome b involved in lipid metabolism